MFLHSSIHVCVCLTAFQEHTKVGSADSQDIQLCGMGIQAEHCVIVITTEWAVVLTPYPNSRYEASPRVSVTHT